MAHSWTYEAIVLKAYDVGEADRFLMIFTRERGRLAVRARGVRKPRSRMGGSLLPLQHVSISLTEGSAGFLVTSAQRKTEICAPGIASFMYAQQGVEFLLSLLHEDEPLPEVFDLTLDFLARCNDAPPGPVLSFTIKLLSLLGNLPNIQHIRTLRFSEAECSYVHTCLTEAWETAAALPPPSRKRLSSFCESIIGEQGTRTLHCPLIAASLAA